MVEFIGYQVVMPNLGPKSLVRSAWDTQWTASHSQSKVPKAWMGAHERHHGLPRPIPSTLNMSI